MKFSTTRFASLLALCLCQATLASPPDGATIYHDFCSVCHGDQGDGRSRARGSMVPPPIDFTSPQAATDLTYARMIGSVANGRPGTAMAPWANQLTSEQIAAVVNYIRNTLMRPIATDTAEKARRLYAENCSVCHGDDGRGAMWTLRNMSPPPRNFAAPEAREELSRGYMVQTVTYGKANTAMPGFDRQLNAKEIGEVVDYVRSAFMRLSAETREPVTAQVAEPSPQSAYPEGLLPDTNAGLAFYMQNCATCHGINGDGKGPRAYFILPKPRDFQHPASRHGLDRARLFAAISKGTRGSEMPAWEKVLTKQEIVNIAEYVYQAFIDVDNEAASTVTQ